MDIRQIRWYTHKKSLLEILFGYRNQCANVERHVMNGLDIHYSSLKFSYISYDKSFYQNYDYQARIYYFSLKYFHVFNFPASG